MKLVAGINQLLVLSYVNKALFLQMKVADLKRELKLRGLAVTGKKEELVERLQVFIETSNELYLS